MNINLTLIAQALAFALFIWFTAKFIWPPLMRAIEQRQKQIADGLAAGEQGRRELEAAGKRAHEELAKARERVGEIIGSAEKRDAQMLDEAKAAARAEAERILAAAKADIDQQVARAKEIACAINVKLMFIFEFPSGSGRARPDQRSGQIT